MCFFSKDHGKNRWKLPTVYLLRKTKIFIQPFNWQTLPAKTWEIRKLTGLTSDIRIYSPSLQSGYSGHVQCLISNGIFSSLCSQCKQVLHWICEKAHFFRDGSMSKNIVNFPIFQYAIYGILNIMCTFVM